MGDVNYQVQEHIQDGTWKGKWRWFSDFRSMNEAIGMIDVYKRFYPKKNFRVQIQHILKGGGV